jgi:hypothetical protein
MFKAPSFYVCYYLYLCHLCVIASGVLPSGDAPLLSLCYGMHGNMAVLFHLVILYAQLEHVPSQDINLHHTHPLCSIEVSMS